MAVTQDIIRMVQASRDRTVELTDQQVVDLTRAYVDAWDDLAPEFSDGLTRLLDAADGEIPAAVVARDQRIAAALTQARTRLDELTDYTNERVGTDVGQAVLDASNTRYDSLQAQLPPEAPGAWLGRIDDDALDNIVARTTQQIASASAPIGADAEAAMRRQLVRGITVGSNPRAVARRIMRDTEGAFNGGLTRASRIARTEMLDAHRYADQQTTQQNRSMVQARVWTSTLDSRTCGSCLAQHGTEWPVEAFGPEDHQQGRCIFVDKTKSWSELGFTGIEDTDMDLQGERNDWWGNLTNDSQDTVLGKTRADMLRNGDIDWPDLSKRIDNNQWRTSYVMTPVRDLTG